MRTMCELIQYDIHLVCCQSYSSPYCQSLLQNYTNLCSRRSDDIARCHRSGSDYIQSVYVVAGFAITIFTAFVIIRVCFGHERRPIVADIVDVDDGVDLDVDNVEYIPPSNIKLPIDVNISVIECDDLPSYTEAVPDSTLYME